MSKGASRVLAHTVLVSIALLAALTLARGAPVAEAAPPNDNFPGTSIPGSPFALPYSNVVATAGWTVQPGELLPNVSCDGAFGVTGTAWYTFIPTVSAPYDFDTFGSTFDTVISVYDGGPFPALNLLACNNDAYHFPRGSRALQVPNMQSSVGLDLVAGSGYDIQVSGNNGAGNLPGDVLVFHALQPFHPIVGGPCAQDHAADTNANGYSDSDEATPNVPGCPAAYPMGGGFGTDPTLIGAAIGCYTDPILARADINLDGAVNGLDLGLLAKNFGMSWQLATPQSTSTIAESDFNGDYAVNGLDLNALAQRFTYFVSPNCGGAGGVPPCSVPALLITALPPGGCATATRTMNLDGSDTITFFWDRTPPGAHVLNLIGAGCPPPVTAGSLPMTVGTPSGTAAVLVTGPPPATCFAQFDATALWP